VITATVRIAIITKARANPNAKQVCEEINHEVGRVSYPTVLRIIKAAGIDLTEAARERMKRLHADPEFAARHSATARARLKRLHADPEYAAANRDRMTRRRHDPKFAALQAAAASTCMKRLHTDPEFEAKRIAGIRGAKAKRRNLG
jgi:hypothetical protein